MKHSAPWQAKYIYLCDVLLYHTVFAWLDVFGVSEHKDPFPLTPTLRFRNESFILFTSAECLKISKAEGMTKGNPMVWLHIRWLTRLVSTTSEGTHCIL